MVLKQSNLQIRPGPDGYSFQIMPSEGHIEFFADDVARVKRVVTQPHREVEIVCDLPTPLLPGVGLTSNEYVQNLSSMYYFVLDHLSIVVPPPVSYSQPTAPASFCPGCGTKVAILGSRFCHSCGGKLP
jgi:hypothetical protein